MQARTILRSQGGQDALPVVGATPPEAAGRRTGRGITPDPEPPPPLAVGLGGLAQGLGPLLLIALVVATVMLVLLRLRAAGALAPAAGPAPAAPDGAPDRPHAGLPDHESLSRAGRFAEAIHALLLRALADLDRRSRQLAPSFTSREIVRRLAPSAAVASALLPLVAAVERMHFGREAATLDDYAACVAHYRAFTEAWRTTR